MEMSTLITFPLRRPLRLGDSNQRVRVSAIAIATLPHQRPTMTKQRDSAEMARLFDKRAQREIAIGANPMLVSGAMICAAIGLIVRSGSTAKAAAMLRTVADRIDPPKISLEMRI